MHKPIPGKLNLLSGKIVHAAYQVHSELGPGLLESVYELCMFHELKRMNLKVERQVTIPVKYRDLTFDDAFKVDIFVEGQIIVELKAVEELIPVHQAQVLTYLKLAWKRIGLLVNFNVPVLKDGLQRIVL